METSNGALINRRRTKLHYHPLKGWAWDLPYFATNPTTYIVPFNPIVKSVHSSTWCAASFGIGMRNPTKSAIFLTMEILHPGPWFRTQSSYYLKPNLSALFQWRTSRAARCWESSPDSSSWEISHFSAMEKAMEKAGAPGALHAPLVIHLSRDPRWRCQWRIY